ncbi:MAG: site-specific DNA-methyltransferase, partial [Magnetococcales bacterium]|nr:site-specific DNA-methyltransferase [Magnetococcales bacterium]
MVEIGLRDTFVERSIERWPVDRLIPYAANARTHSDEQVAKVAASIKEFGFNNPILVDGKDGIIAGHCRLMAARKIGLTDVPVIVLDHLSDAQRRAYILADNKLALDAGWDDDLLKSALEGLEDDGFDMSLIGFSDDELSSILVDDDHAEPGSIGDADDEAPPPPQTPVSRECDIWILGDHRLMCGDSTSISDMHLLCNGQTVDMWLTDPPYNV